MNKNTAVKNLTTGNEFTVAPYATVYVARLVRTEGARTSVVYVVKGRESAGEFEFVKANLATVKGV